MTSSSDISDMFEVESAKLTKLIDIASSKSTMSVHEIVETYYQVMNVSSMITMLKQQLNQDEHKSILARIEEDEKIISTKFDSEIHPRILLTLSSSIHEITKSLQSQNSGEKSKEQIEKESLLYETLKQKMSTKEFVEQYDQGLSHD